MIEFFKTKKQKKTQKKIQKKTKKNIQKKNEIKKSISNIPKPIQTKSSMSMPMPIKISIGRERTMEEKIKIWDQLAGMNPTGQMMYKNGILKSKGNIAQILTPQQLQSKNLDKTAINNPISQNIQIEGFENMKNGDTFFKIHHLVYGLLLLICVFIFILNIKKIKYKLQI
jgi:hypothetical protein